MYVLSKSVKLAKETVEYKVTRNGSTKQAEHRILMKNLIEHKTKPHELLEEINITAYRKINI